MSLQWNCSKLKEWRIESTNYDGEPRKMAIPADDCSKCVEFTDCVAKVRTAFVMDRLTEQVARLQPNAGPDQAESELCQMGLSVND